MYNVCTLKHSQDLIYVYVGAPSPSQGLHFNRFIKQTSRQHQRTYCGDHQHLKLLELHSTYPGIYNIKSPFTSDEFSSLHFAPRDDCHHQVCGDLRTQSIPHNAGVPLKHRCPYPPWAAPGRTMAGRALISRSRPRNLSA
jgi:hypothetical protein